MSHKFKIGDKVIVDCVSNPIFKRWFTENWVYIISNIQSDGGTIFFEDTLYVCSYEDIILAGKLVRNTKLARKMYPDHEIDGEFLRIKL